MGRLTGQSVSMGRLNGQSDCTDQVNRLGRVKVLSGQSEWVE